MQKTKWLAWTMLLCLVAVAGGGCSKSPSATAVELIKAADDGRSADAIKLLEGGDALYQNEWNFDPWFPRPGGPAPHWIDHVSVTKVELPAKNSYGEELAYVTVEVYPKNGGRSGTETCMMKKTGGVWLVYAIQSSGLAQKPIQPTPAP